MQAALCGPWRGWDRGASLGRGHSKAAAPPASQPNVPGNARRPLVLTVDVDNRYLFIERLSCVLGTVQNTTCVHFTPTPALRVAAFIPSLPKESNPRNRNLSHEGTCPVPC